MSVTSEPAKPARTRVGRALDWWLGELAALWGDALRSLALDGRNAPVLEAGERYWLLRRRDRLLGQIDCGAGDAAERLRRLAAATRSAAVTVEIPAERVLAKRITLPAPARGELERILRFETARHFPFPAERVHFRHRVLADRGGRGTIEVEIVAVPREIVTGISDTLHAAGVRPRAIAVAGAPPLFLHTAVLGRRSAALKPVDRALAAVLALLVAAALASPLLADRMRLQAIDARTAQLAPKVQALIDARERASRAGARLAAPLRLVASRPPLVLLLDRLTKAVPDGTWLVSLALSGHELVIDGLSPSAAATALALEHSGAFANVVFRAPITRDPATGLERFELAAAVAEPKP